MATDAQHNGSFIRHLANHGVVFGQMNSYDIVMAAMLAKHKNSTENDICNAFNTIAEAKKNGKQDIFVKTWRNHGGDDVKLSLKMGGTSGSLINGVTGQPTHHCS